MANQPKAKLIKRADVPAYKQDNAKVKPLRAQIEKKRVNIRMTPRERFLAQFKPDPPAEGK